MTKNQLYDETLKIFSPVEIETNSPMMAIAASSSSEGDFIRFNTLNKILRSRRYTNVINPAKGVVGPARCKLHLYCGP